MQLNRKTLILLGGSVLVIIGALLLQAPLQGAIASATPTAALQTLLPDNLVELASQFIVRQGEDFTEIDKIDGLWQITDGTALDETRETFSEFVEGLLGLMAGFEYTSVFEPDDLSQFGLDDPTVSITIQTATDRYRLYLGRVNPDGDRVYVRLNDATTVYLVPAVFELGKIVQLATEPPYRPLVAEATPELADNLLFPEVFGYQIAEFMIQDQRDGSFIRYTQGDLGTWLVDGTLVDEARAINDVQAAVNVSQFLFLNIEPLDLPVIDSVTDLPILTLSMTTDDDQTYTMDIIVVDDLGYVGVLDDGIDKKAYRLPTDTVNQFFDKVRQPPYADVNS